MPKNEAPKVPKGLIDLAVERMKAVPGSAEYQTAEHRLYASIQAPGMAPWMVEEANRIARDRLDREAKAEGKQGWTEPVPELLPQQKAYLEEVKARQKAEAEAMAYVPPGIMPEAEATGPAEASEKVEAEN